MQEQPLISVIIPSFNAAETIGVALQSMIDQTYTNLEIIVVDDKSTDNTEQVVAAYQVKDSRIHYYRATKDDQNRVNAKGRNINGGWSARNYGFTKCTGEWIVFQDADDASLLNRIELQFALALQHNAVHVTVNWIQFDEQLLGKKVDGERLLRDHPESLIGSEEIYRIAKKAKGIIPSWFGQLHRFIPFSLKQARIFNHLFFGTLAPYPGTGHALFHRSVMEKIKFRSRDERVWPSFVGRGADRDFNFEVAETFRKSISIDAPAYLWRVPSQNPEVAQYLPYIVD